MLSRAEPSRGVVRVSTPVRRVWVISIDCLWMFVEMADYLWKLVFLDFLYLTDNQRGNWICYVASLVEGLIWLNFSYIWRPWNLFRADYRSNLPGLAHQAEEQVTFADSGSSPHAGVRYAFWMDDLLLRFIVQREAVVRFWTGAAVHSTQGKLQSTKWKTRARSQCTEEWRAFRDMMLARKQYVSLHYGTEGA